MRVALELPFTEHCWPFGPEFDVFKVGGKIFMIVAVAHGRPPVSLYLEVSEDRAEVFVRDRGVGFDPDAVPSDRQGLAKSIRSRVERRGGTVEVRSAPGRGTEVRLTIARPAEGDEIAHERAEENA